MTGSGVLVDGATQVEKFLREGPMSERFKKRHQRSMDSFTGRAGRSRVEIRRTLMMWSVVSSFRARGRSRCMCQAAANAFPRVE